MKFFRISAYQYLILFVAIGCVADSEVKYEESVSHPNFYDSLNHIASIKEIKSISLQDSIENKRVNKPRNADSSSLALSSSYLLSGMQTINVFEQLQVAHELNKPLILYFTAVGCMNCRKMEEEVLDSEEVSSMLDSTFVFIPLCVDDRTKLPQDYWIQNPWIDEQDSQVDSLRTPGAINSYLQIVLSRSGTQPTFIALDINSELGTTTYTKNKEEFLGYLKEVVNRYRLENDKL